MARRDPRQFLFLDIGFPENPKVSGLSDGAFRLYVEVLCYCARALNDGQICLKTWSKLGRKQHRDALTKTGLIQCTETHAVLPDYLDHQSSAEEVKTSREKRALAGQRGGRAKAANRAKTLANGVANAIAKPVANGYPDASRALPDIEVDIEGSYLRGEGYVPNAHDNPPPHPRCLRHLFDLTPPPCGGCADARRAYTAWEQTQRTTAHVARSTASAAALAAAADCATCGGHGWVLAADGTPVEPAQHCTHGVPHLRAVL